ncbi:MAG: hypothetical protein RR356_02985 [Bacteroidales bacterium]
MKIEFIKMERLYTLTFATLNDVCRTHNKAVSQKRGIFFIGRFFSEICYLRREVCGSPLRQPAGHYLQDGKLCR